jgi:hypothetical protein
MRTIVSLEHSLLFLTRNRSFNGIGTFKLSSQYLRSQFFVESLFICFFLLSPVRSPGSGIIVSDLRFWKFRGLELRLWCWPRYRAGYASNVGE